MFSDYRPETYGDRTAGLYDAWIASSVAATTDAAVDFLLSLAAQGTAALELGVGTGRIAMPLAQRGVRVQGVDASEAMVARLREKAGGVDVPITIGDFADVGVDGQFHLVYVVFNTFFALSSQADQVRCFRNVAAHLTPDGHFVIEAFVPDPTLFDRQQRVSAPRVELERIQLDVSRHNPVLQQVTTQHVMIGREGIMLLPVQLRYAWPSELDLMAQLAGLRLVERFGGWSREPFSASSASHVSVYACT